MKLGSLFDGIGGFPLSAVRCGIEPVWASEIEPFPILTTYKRFPKMKHLGSVTDINGAEVEPVDILTFGSPCQDLSVAGKQAGIHDGERSNLFFEAVRIIKEMRANDETAGRPAELRRPRFAVWENVPGAFSSNKGTDFQAVLQALAEVADPDVSVPLPAKGKWDKAGFILGDGYSIVWRTYDAQFWGVPQRRKRIYLVADFGGQRANEILFDPESVRGDSAQSGAPWQGIAPDAEGGAGRSRAAGFIGRQGDGAGSVGYENEKSPTLRGSITSDVVYCLQGNGIDRADTAGCNGKGWREDTSYTLNTIDRPAVVSLDCRNMSGTPELSGTLQAKDQGGHSLNYINPIVYPGVGVTSPQNGANPKAGDPCGTLSTDSRNYLVYDARGNGEGGISPTLTGDRQNRVTDYTGIVVQPQLASGKETTGCLLASGYDKLGAQEMFSGDYTVLHGFDMQAIGAYGESGTSSTLKRRDYKDATDLVVEADRKHIVRRLTPLECCRLQGYPDGWTENLAITNPTEEDIAFFMKVWSDWAAINGTKPKTRAQVVKWLADPQSDSAEYKAYGNSLAIPCAYDVISRVAKQGEIK